MSVSPLNPVADSNLEAQAAPPRREGFLERTVGQLLLRRATVTSAIDLSSYFRLIDVAGDGLRQCNWAPGDKVQIRMDGPGFINRTYTPLSWDRGAGRTQFLAYCHGDAPGSRWAKDVRTGDEHQLFGPRHSLSLELTAPTVMFGDETSFALAVALERSAGNSSSRHYFFEVNDRSESTSVLGGLALPSASVFQRDHDSHLSLLIEEMLDVGVAGSTFILTGKATSIQQVSRALKASGIATRSLRTKAYWAPGKVGLD